MANIIVTKIEINNVEEKIIKFRLFFTILSKKKKMLIIAINIREIGDLDKNKFMIVKSNNNFFINESIILFVYILKFVSERLNTIGILRYINSPKFEGSSKILLILFKINVVPSESKRRALLLLNIPIIAFAISN